MTNINNNYFFKNILSYFILVITALIFFPYSLMAETESPKIIIHPFLLYCDKEQSQNTDTIKKQAESLLVKHLQDAGASVFKTDGNDIAAEYIIKGSITKIGDSFSIDVGLIKLSNNSETTTSGFSRYAKDIEDLNGAVQNISDDIIGKIFVSKKIADIEISGNNRIESDAIIRIISSQKGGIYSLKTISEDIKSIYHMGYFEDIKVEKEDIEQGKKIIIKVKENPTIRNITIKGNRIYDTDKIKENLYIKKGAILNIFELQKSINSIKELYKDKNYQKAEVFRKLKEVDDNMVDIEIAIEEGKKIKITKIEFVKNKVYSDKKLKKLMKTSEKHAFSWLTGSGEFKKEAFDQDLLKIRAFYRKNGYIFQKTGDPEITYTDDSIHIKIEIEEGERYKVGKVDIEGDIIKNKNELLKYIELKKEKFFNAETMEKDTLYLTDIYLDKGYAYAEIIPLTNVDKAEKIVDITYKIDKKEKIFFDKIIISGNTKTRDKVIRRNLEVYEQGIYNGTALRRSIRNINRLDYFQKVNVETSKGAQDNNMNLKIDAEEKNTGMLSFGGGYSDVDHAYFMASISERNLFGRGQTLKLNAQLGGVTNKYTLSFIEPWLFGIPLSAGIDIFNWEKNYDYYDKDSQGFAFKFGYPVFRDTRLYCGYEFENADIKNIQPEAADVIKEMEGRNIESSVTANLVYDTTNSMFNPTEGARNSLFVQYAGLGGDIGFTKYVLEMGLYFPLISKTIGFIHTKSGYLEASSDKRVPTYERFNLGGMNSLRGFNWEDLSPSTINNDGEISYIGGNKFVQFNFEIIHPLFENIGLMGVVFYDTGNVYDGNENIDFGNLRESAGYGVRWMSPIGPLRLENGYILDRKDNEQKGGKWEFSIGAAF